MSSDQRQQVTLWMEPQTARRFLIPESAVLPSGTLELTTALGRWRRVDEVAVLAFEVSEDGARQWLATQAATMVRRLQEASAAAGEEQAGDKGKARDAARPDPAGSESTSGPNGAEWARLLNGMAERFAEPGDDRATALARAATSIGAQVVGIAVRAAGGGPAGLRHAQDQADRLEVLLDDLGFHLEGALSALPEVIRARYRRAMQQGDPAAHAERLEQMAALVEGGAVGLSARLRSLADHLRRRPARHETRPAHAQDATNRR